MSASTASEHEDPKNIDRHGRGRWSVERYDTLFGPVLRHGLDGPVLFMALPRTAGWKAMARGFQKLAHQTYVKDAEEYLAENRYTREIAVVDLNNGEWVTVWETGWPSGVRADWMPPRVNLGVADE